MATVPGAIKGNEMKEIFKTITAIISGLLSSAYAGIENVRLSIVEMIFSDFNHTLDITSRIVALIISIMSMFYLYYRIRIAICDYKEKTSHRGTENTEEEK